MTFRALIAAAFLAAGCSALSDTTVVRPDPPAGMETIDIPGSTEESVTESGTLPPGQPDRISKLVPGDLVTIQVYGQPDLSLETRIPVSGDVNYPVIGKVQLAGKLTGEVEADMKTRLEEKLLNCAQVTVLVKEYNTRCVYVLGSVSTPGSYDIAFGRSLSLLQAVSKAGGYKDDADRDNMLLVRETDGKRTAYRLAYTEIVKKGRVEKDVGLQDGDILIVQERGKVYVLGEVNAPGGFTVPSGEKFTLTKALSLAKWFSSLASPSRTTVVRTLADGTTRIFRINVGSILSGQLSDPTMLPGDIVFVPESMF
jgi:polysaccharide export outer membrane protein